MSGKNGMSPSKFYPRHSAAEINGVVHVAETLPSEVRVGKDKTCMPEVNT